MKEEDMPLKDLLLKRGYIVTDKCFNGDKWNRMITDLEGNEIGYFEARNVLEKLNIIPDENTNQLSLF